MRLVTAALISCLAHTTLAATVTHNFTIGWVLANPDGAQVRPVIGINGAWPIPRIDVDIHDRLIVNVRNDLGNQSTSLHFHGLFQNGTTQMDGPAQVSQCAIPPGHSFTYNFTVDQPGTYWYHSHTQSQYPDGLRGALVVHDPKSPYDGKYDEEVVLTLSDWYHDQMAELIPKFLNKRNPTGAEPVPQAALMNDTQNLTLAMQPGKTYLIRMVNMAAFAAQYVWFEGHDVQVVEVDGVYTKPSTAEMLYIAAAQRCSVLLTAKNDTSSNFPIVGSMDTSLFDTIPDGLNWNVTGWLVYDDAKPKPEPKLVDEYTPIDDMTLVPYDDQPRLPEPDKVVELDVVMQNLGDGANYAFFNNITYVAPKVPTLYTALTAGGAAADPEVYGAYTHAFVLKRNQVVQINVNNLDPGRHPFHLHGHHFQALHRSPEDGGTVEASGVNETEFPAVPMRRDTVVVWPSGNVVLRFRADNPGVWLFHCHIEWHVTSGLIATFVEAPLHLQRTLEVPEDHFAVCEAAGVPTAGNAAGNSRDLLDLAGENKPPPPLPAGFTTRGIVAFVFSCVAGILGIIVVAWYGMAGGPEDERNGADEVSSPAALGAASFWADGAGQGSENRVETGSGSLRAASRAS